MKLEPTVFVVDDDASVRKLMRWLLEGANLRVETYARAREFLQFYHPAQPGCLILDVRMPGMSGLELQEELVARGIRLPIILVSGHGDVPTAVRAMKAGAVDFLEKPFGEQVLLARVREALRQDAEARAAAGRRPAVAEQLRQLTPRERDVLRKVAAGMSSKAIALDLGLTPKTIECIRSRILKKVNAKNTPQLVQLAMAAQLHEGPALDLGPG